MKNIILFLGFLIIIMLIGGCGGSVISPQDQDDKISYDWNIKIILCKECSPYKSEKISQDELEQIKDEFISNYDQGEVIFDKFIHNGFLVNVTNQVKDRIGEANITGAKLRTYYFTLIIDEKRQKKPSFFNDKELYQCNEDRECVSVKSGCCGCGSGGTSIAINRNYLNYWNEKLTSECKSTMCSMAMSQHVSCFSKPTCVNSECTLIPAENYICNSSLFRNCKEHTSKDRLDEVSKQTGISCREVIELCE